MTRFARVAGTWAAVVLTVLLASGCSPGKKETTRSFYYWKSRFALSDSDRAFLRTIEVRRIYLRFFDVAWDADVGGGVPVAPVQFASPPGTTMDYVPVVYVVNDVLRRTDRRAIPDLARNIHHQVARMADEWDMRFAELQLDCDWTLHTRDAYFALLKAIRPLLARGTRLSATIRLHQLVHADRTGVPPVDRGMLMFYNMGKVSPDETANSIYSPGDAQGYLDQYHGYPLSLDAVLPLYEWSIQFRQGAAVERHQTVRERDLRAAGIFTRVGDGLYRADGSFVFRGGYVRTGDILKVERVDLARCAQAARTLAAALERENRAVAIFAFDSPDIRSQAPHAIESIFRAF
jgi:hypothetical protein